MKIVTQNIEFLFGEGTHEHSGKEWVYTKSHVEARINHYAGLFANLDADVVLLQEIASKSVVERIIAKTGIDYFYFFAEPDQNGVGNVVLYKQKNAVCESIPAFTSLPVFVEGDVDTIGARIWSRRDFVHMQTTWRGKKVHILNLHIKQNFLMPMKNNTGITLPMDSQISAADGLIRSEMFRFSQAKRLREIIDTFFADDPDTLVVVGGDFNAELDDSAYRIIRGVIQDSPSYLVDACTKIDQAKRFSLVSNKTGRERLVDHFLISKNLVSHLSDVNILNGNISENNNVAPNPSLVGSDHAPIVININ